MSDPEPNSGHDPTAMASTAPYYQPVRRPSQSNMGRNEIAIDGSSTQATAPTYDAQTSAAMAINAAIFPIEQSYSTGGANGTGRYTGRNENGDAQSPVENNDQLASLLQAANSAAGAEKVVRDGHTLAEGTRTSGGSSFQTRNMAALAADVASGKGKRKRTSSSPTARAQGEPVDDTDNAAAQLQLQNDADTARSRTSKRSKHNASIANEFSGGPSAHTSTASVNRPPPDFVTGPFTDPRSLGVHSAAALFRRSSTAASTPRNSTSNNAAATPGGGGGSVKKQTRPPMSKLFTSLRLSAENFLRLQSAAKNYMLDPAHPERQNCVGNRGSSDSDMVKLRLFNCVREFLDREGAGERFFGEHAATVSSDSETTGAISDDRDVALGLGLAVPPDDSDAGGGGLFVDEHTPNRGGGEAGEMDHSTAKKLWIWPRDANKIVSLVTPLLRRMVTNERQRQYAIETRKGGKKGLDGELQGTPSRNMVQRGMTGAEIMNSAAIDPSLQVVQPPVAPMATTSSQFGGSFPVSVRLFIAPAYTTPGAPILVPPIDLSPMANGDGPNFDQLLGTLGTMLHSVTTTSEDAKHNGNGDFHASSFATNDEQAIEVDVGIDAVAGDERDGTKFRRVSIVAQGIIGMVQVMDVEAWENVRAQVREAYWMEGTLRVVVTVLD